jgi:hypothetical protein
MLSIQLPVRKKICNKATNFRYGTCGCSGVPQCAEYGRFLCGSKQVSKVAVAGSLRAGCAMRSGKHLEVRLLIPFGCVRATKVGAVNPRRGFEPPRSLRA